MLWVWAATLFGIFRFRGPAYWKWVGILILWMLAASFLFQAGGTLENPSGDGLITHQVRVMTNDGVGMALFAILFLIAFYGGIVLIARKLWENGKTIEYEALEREWEDGASVPLGRKLIETVLVTALAAGWVYAFTILPARKSRQSVSNSTASTTPKTLSSPEPQDPVEADLALAAADLNRDVPKKIDAITTLVSASSTGRVFQYNYMISRREGTDEQLLAFVRNNAVAKACKDPQRKQEMKEFGIAYRYSYKLPDRQSPITMTATYDECKAMGLA